MTWSQIPDSRHRRKRELSPLPVPLASGTSLHLPAVRAL